MIAYTIIVTYVKKDYTIIVSYNKSVNKACT